MTRRRPITLRAGAVAIPLVALAVAACGGGGATAATPASTPASNPPPTPATTPTQTASVRVAKTRLGSILVDSSGRTLYLFKGDTGTKTACTGACATAWPPLRSSGKPMAGGGVKAALLGATPRLDGGRQVTYNGHPLYLFIKDKKPGQVNGQGLVAFGAAWYVVSPTGMQITRHTAKHGTGSSSSRPAAPASPPATTTQPAPKAATQPAPAPSPPPAPKTTTNPAPPATSGIPQNNGGDGDADNNGGPSDGDGNV